MASCSNADTHLPGSKRSRGISRDSRQQQTSTLKRQKRESRSNPRIILVKGENAPERCKELADSLLIHTGKNVLLVDADVFNPILTNQMLQINPIQQTTAAGYLDSQFGPNGHYAIPSYPEDHKICIFDMIGVCNDFFGERFGSYTRFRHPETEVYPVSCMKVRQFLFGETCTDELTNPHDMLAFDVTKNITHVLGGNKKVARIVLNYVPEHKTGPNANKINIIPPVQLDDIPGIYLCPGRVGTNMGLNNAFDEGMSQSLHYGNLGMKKFHSIAGIVRATIERTAKRYCCENVVICACPSWGSIFSILVYASADGLILSGNLTSRFIWTLQSEQKSLLHVIRKYVNYQEQHYTLLRKHGMPLNPARKYYPPRDLCSNPVMFLGTLVSAKEGETKTIIEKQIEKHSQEIARTLDLRKKISISLGQSASIDMIDRVMDYVGNDVRKFWAGVMSPTEFLQSAKFHERYIKILIPGTEKRRFHPDLFGGMFKVEDDGQLCLLIIKYV